MLLCFQTYNSLVFKHSLLVNCTVFNLLVKLIWLIFNEFVLLLIKACESFTAFVEIIIDYRNQHLAFKNYIINLQ